MEQGQITGVGWLLTIRAAAWYTERPYELHSATFAPPSSSCATQQVALTLVPPGGEPLLSGTVPHGNAVVLHGIHERSVDEDVPCLEIK